MVVNPPTNTSANQASNSQTTKYFPNKDVQKKDEEKDALKKDVPKEKDPQENVLKKIQETKIYVIHV